MEIKQGIRVERYFETRSIYSFMNKHLSCFLFGVIMNKASMNVHVKVSL